MATAFLSICPHCQTKLKLKNPDLIGKKAKCPKCTEPFVVKRAKVKPKPQSAAAASPAKKAAPQPEPESAAGGDDWLNDDLGSFDTDDQWPSTGDSPAPPMVTGVKTKRQAPSGSRPKKRRSDDEEPNTLVSVLLACAAGCVAAAIGAGIWITIVIVTGYEIGLLAWAIGGLVGFGTLLGSRAHIVGDLSGMIAAVIALLAVTGPKLIILVLAKLVGEPIGLGDVFTLFDILWIFLAVGTAFRVGSGQAGDE